jgi:hypothetical protein
MTMFFGIGHTPRPLRFSVAHVDTDTILAISPSIFDARIMALWQVFARLFLLSSSDP